MSLLFSYRHLYYFWVVAKEGGMVRELERSLGHTLLRPAGCGLALTEAGLAVDFHPKLTPLMAV